MDRGSTTTKSGIKPINQWVADALSFSRLSQSELAAKLADRQIITSKDRSFVNKMTLGKRKVSADEAAAISEITGYPPLDSKRQDPRLAEIIQIYQSLPENFRELYAQQVRAVANAARTPEPSPTPPAERNAKPQ